HAGETAWRDSDDACANVAYLEKFAEHVSAAELRFPERIRQHGDVGAARREVLVFVEEATECGTSAEEGEERCAHRAHASLACDLAAADREGSLGKCRQL